MPAHQAQKDFPQTMEALAAYDAVILSDIGANTLLLHPDTWIHSKTTPNRLKLLRDYVEQGGALLMFGGYYSFQGINGGARYARTPVEDVLPVTCLRFDDRVEVPEGFAPVVTGRGLAPDPLGARHGLAGSPRLQRGRAEARRRGPGDRVRRIRIAAAARHRTYGKGRSVVWTSDVGPHWLPGEFIRWDGYAKLFAAMLDWATAK